MIPVPILTANQDGVKLKVTWGGGTSTAFERQRGQTKRDEEGVGKGRSQGTVRPNKGAAKCLVANARAASAGRCAKVACREGGRGVFGVNGGPKRLFHLVTKFTGVGISRRARKTVEIRTCCLSTRALLYTCGKYIHYLTHAEALAG